MKIDVLFLVFALLSIGVFAFEIPQNQLVPPYKTMTRGNIDVDMTLDQVYNEIGPDKSTRYYILRIHNRGAMDLNVPRIVTRFDVHLVGDGSPSNYEFYQFEGYRTSTDFDGNTVYWTNWTEIPFTSLSVPAGATQTIGVGFDINRPFAQGRYDMSIDMSGTEFFIDPDISACGTISSSGTYTLTTDISERTTTCFTISANNVMLDLNGKTVDGTGAAGSYGVDGSANSHNFKLINGTIKEFERGFYTNDGPNNVLFDKMTFTNFSDMSIYFLINPSANITVRNSRFYLNGGSAGYQVAINALTNDTVLVTDTNISCFSKYTSIFKPTSIVTAYYGSGTPNNKIYTFHNVNISDCEQGFALGSVFDNSTEIWDGNGSTTLQNTSLWLTSSNAVLANDNATRILRNFRVIPPFNNTHWFDATSGLGTVIDQITYLNWTGINNTQIKNQYDVASTNYSLLLQHYERFNFTLSDGTPQSSNFRLNNSINGEIVNATAGATGLSNWIVVNDTKYTHSANTSYNPYTLNSHPSTAGYSMNTSILSFTTTGTWNITFYKEKIISLTPENWTANVSNSAQYQINYTIQVSGGLANLTIYLVNGTNLSAWTNTSSLVDFNGTYLLPVHVNTSYWATGLIPVYVYVNSTTGGFSNVSAELWMNVTFVSVCTSAFGYSHIRFSTPSYTNRETTLAVFYANEYGEPGAPSICNLKAWNSKGVLEFDRNLSTIGHGIFLTSYVFGVEDDYFLLSNCECESMTGTDSAVIRPVNFRGYVRDTIRYELEEEAGELVEGGIFGLSWFQAGFLMILIVFGAWVIIGR